MTLDEYMALPYSMTLEADPYEGGYVVSFPDLPGCLTCADTAERAILNAEDAKRVWLESAIEDGQSIPLPNDLANYSGQLRLRLPRSMHKQLVMQSEREGISMNQYILYQLAGCLAKAARS